MGVKSHSLLLVCLMSYMASFNLVSQAKADTIEGFGDIVDYSGYELFLDDEIGVHRRESSENETKRRLKYGLIATFIHLITGQHINHRIHSLPEKKHHRPWNESPRAKMHFSKDRMLIRLEYRF